MGVAPFALRATHLAYTDVTTHFWTCGCGATITEVVYIGVHQHSPILAHRQGLGRFSVFQSFCPITATIFGPIWLCIAAKNRGRSRECVRTASKAVKVAQSTALKKDVTLGINPSTRLNGPTVVVYFKTFACLNITNCALNIRKSSHARCRDAWGS